MAINLWNRKGQFCAHTFNNHIRPREWVARPDQIQGVQWLLDHPRGGLAIDPGSGKTSTTLHAFHTLRQQNPDLRMLVVAPVRVCATVWGQECYTWQSLAEARYRVIWVRGDAIERKKRLRLPGDIWLMNPEQLTWLRQEVMNNEIDTPGFDIIVNDELTKFKNLASKRTLSMQGFSAVASRVWGLTGTLAPNGYKDVYGQFVTVTQSNELGQTYAAFLSRNFDRMEGKLRLRREGRKRIEETLSRYFMRTSYKNTDDQPVRHDNIIQVDMPRQTQAAIQELREGLLQKIEDGEIKTIKAVQRTFFFKMLQLSGGAIYDDNHVAVRLHDAKLDALHELLDELQGGQLMVVYNYNHELHRITELLDKLRITHAQINGSMTPAKSMEAEHAWNTSEVQVLMMNPKSGHLGLNLQKSHASNICWFGLTPDLEAYVQTLHRVIRQGNKSPVVHNHIIMATDTLDAVCMGMLHDKRYDLNRLHEALTMEVEDMGFRSEGTIPDASPVTNGSGQALQPASPGGEAAHAHLFAGQAQAAQQQQPVQQTGGYTLPAAPAQPGGGIPLPSAPAQHVPQQPAPQAGGIPLPSAPAQPQQQPDNRIAQPPHPGQVHVPQQPPPAATIPVPPPQSAPLPERQPTVTTVLPLPGEDQLVAKVAEEPRMIHEMKLIAESLDTDDWHAVCCVWRTIHNMPI